jgi:hypothetical protein
MSALQNVVTNGLGYSASTSSCGAGELQGVNMYAAPTVWNVPPSANLRFSNITPAQKAEFMASMAPKPVPRMKASEKNDPSNWMIPDAYIGVL